MLIMDLSPLMRVRNGRSNHRSATSGIPTAYILDKSVNVSD